MTRAAVFTQGDIQKLLKGAKAAGMTVREVVIDPTGRIVAKLGGSAGGTDDEPNEWDEVFTHGPGKRTAAQRQRVQG